MPMHAVFCSYLYVTHVQRLKILSYLKLILIVTTTSSHSHKSIYNMKVIYNHKLYNDVYARVSNIILKLDIMIELFSSIHTFNQQIYFFLSDATSFPPFFVSSNAIAAALNSSTVNTCDLQSGQVKLED